MNVVTRPGRAPAKNMAWVPGGSFAMGSADFYPEERPVRRVAVDGFWMDDHSMAGPGRKNFADQAPDRS